MKKLLTVVVCLVTFGCSTVKEQYIKSVPKPKPYVKVNTAKKGLYDKIVFNQCIEEIKVIEGFRATSYFDINNYAIGYGHQLIKGDTLTYISKKDAEILLIKDFKKRIDYVYKHYKFTGNKLLAVARFTFNLGGVNTKKLLSKPNIEKRWLLYCHIKHEDGYKKSNHLYKCRQRELELWLS